MNTKQLIQKFWSGSASVKEQQQLLKQLEIQDDELKTELKELFDQHAETGPRTLTPEQKNRVYENIIATIGEQTDRRKTSLPRTIIQIAASLLLIAGAGWGLWSYQQSDKNTLIAVAPVDKRIVNNTASFEKHRLPDGSTVTLSPHSSLTYNPQFTDSSRVLSLMGMGKFAVAKDKHRPFTVIANGIATTALGTVFIIDGQHGQETNIHLVEGSIRVAPTISNTHSFHETILRAGEQIVINTHTQQLKWKVSKPIELDRKRTVVRSKKTVIAPLEARNATLNFEKESLKTVFEAIAKSKQIAIVCEGEALDQLTFTGAFQTSESAENMLNILCALNELEYRKEQSTYYVVKKQDTAH